MEQTTNSVVPKEGWSWGAFMLNIYFLIGAKRYQLLWWYLLAAIPLVNVVFLLAFSIYLGVKGHEIAAQGTMFENQSEYDGFVKGLDHAGKIMFFAVLILAVVILVGMIILFAAGGFAAMHDMHQAGPMQPYYGQ